MATKVFERLRQIPPSEIESELNELRQQRVEIDQKIKLLDDLLALPKTVGTVPPQAAPEEPAMPQLREGRLLGAPEPVPFLREGIVNVLLTDLSRPWKLAEIFRAMVERGWLSDDASGRNRLQLRMADMASKGELVKPGYGYYQFAPASNPLLQPPKPEEEGP